MNINRINAVSFKGKIIDAHVHVGHWKGANYTNNEIDVFTKSPLQNGDTIEKIIKDSGIENITDDSAIREIIKSVINANPQSVEDYKQGHDRAIKFLMGQVMKETKGSANPKMAMDILLEELN